MAPAASAAVRSKNLSWITSIREEDIGTIPFVANSAQVLPSQGGILPSDKFYYGLRLKVRFRLTVAAAAAVVALNEDAPFSLINRIRIEGYHRPRAAQEAFFDMRGPDIHELFGVTQGAPETDLRAIGLGGGAVGALAPVLPRPPRVASVSGRGFGLAVNDINDVIFFLDIIFPPCWPVPSPGINRQQAQWLLDAPNYDRLTMTVFWGDLQNLVTAALGANPPVLSGFGQVGAGVPDCTVQALYALGGKNNLFQGFVPGRVWRYFAENTTGDILATVVNSRQYNIPRGFKIARLLTKTGVKSANVTAGNDAYATTLNTMLTRIILNYGTNKIIRFHADQHSLRETNRQNLILPSDGYGIVDFLQHGHLGEALDAQSLVAGPTGDVDVFLSANTLAGANQGALYMVEELRGMPQFVS
jgi:hypothetical protein